MIDRDHPTIVFFQGSRTYRNRRTAVAMVACVLFGYFPSRAAIRMLQSGDVTPVGLFGAVLSLCFMFCLAKGVPRMVTGRVEHLEVTADGIRYGSAFWTWDRIASIGVSRRFSDGLFLAIEVRNHSSGPLWQSVVGVRVRRPLPVDEPLTPDRYDAFTGRIRPWLREHYPHVELDSSSLPAL